MPDLLQKLDALAVRMLAQGRIPPPFLLVQALLAAGQSLDSPIKLARTGEHLSVAYVSPNTDSGGTIRDAYEQMRGPDMQRLAHSARALPGVRGGESGVGFWSDGAEASHVIEADPQTVAQVAKALGEQFKQKSVLSFISGTGDDKAHILTVPSNDPERIHRDMMRHGIEYKTVIPGTESSTVHVVDVGNAIEPQINAYAKEAGAEHIAYPGTAQFVTFPAA